jgi:N-acetylglucosamine kinase-like BadF-type ATPase
VSHLDGRAREVLLMDLFQEHLARESQMNGRELEAPGTWIRRIAQAPDRVAALAPLVIASAAVGDAASGRDLDEGAAALAYLARTVASRANLPPTSPFYLHGGLLQQVAAYRDRVMARLGEALPGRPVQLTPPGALLGGLRRQLFLMDLCRPP